MNDELEGSFDKVLTALRALSSGEPSFLDDASQSIYNASQNAKGYIGGLLSNLADNARSIPGALADAKTKWDEDIQPLLMHTANVYPSGILAGLRYAVLPDDYEIEYGIPQSGRNALAQIIANNEDIVRRQGIGYSLYQDIGGGTDLAGRHELPTNYGADIAAKIIGGVGRDNIFFNEDGSVTIKDKFNVNIHPDLLKDLREQRLQRSGGKNISGALLGDAELYMQLMRNAMASVRPDMYDYQYPATAKGEIDPREREIPGYVNVVNLTPEEMQAAREGREYVPRSYAAPLAAASIAPAPYAMAKIAPHLSGLLGFLGDLGKPTEGGMRGF